MHNPVLLNYDCISIFAILDNFTDGSFSIEIKAPRYKSALQKFHRQTKSWGFVLTKKTVITT